MDSSEIDRYTMMVWPCTGFYITGMVAMNCLSCVKSSSLLAPFKFVSLLEQFDDWACLLGQFWNESGHGS